MAFPGAVVERRPLASAGKRTPKPFPRPVKDAFGGASLVVIAGGRAEKVREVRHHLP
jgi:hypothetical protein